MTTATPRFDIPEITLPDPTAIGRAATDTLDRMEALLPALPAAGLRFQRAVARRAGQVVSGSCSRLRGSIGSMSTTTATASRTVTGTARWATEQTAQTAQTALRTVWGQTRAQADIAASAIAAERDALRDDIEAAADDAARVVNSVAAQVEPADSTGPIYETWTKDRLYAEAQALDVDGRSSMTKRELIDALRRT